MIFAFEPHATRFRINLVYCHFVKEDALLFIVFAQLNIFSSDSPSFDLIVFFKHSVTATLPLLY